MRNLNLMKVVNSQFSRRSEMHWEKEPLLVTINFFFSHRVFKSSACRQVKIQVCFERVKESVFVFGRVDNIVRKGEIDGYRYF